MKKYDLIVVGGGLTGVCAAVRAARDGLSVCLTEKEGSLGGAISHNLVYPFMGCHTKMPDGTIKKLCAGMFLELLAKNNLADESNNPNYHFRSEEMKFTLDEMTEEAGVDVLFHVMLSGVKTENGKIESLTFATKCGALDLCADYYIDATGDGNLFTLAGCDFHLGRETDSLCQPMTTCFRMSNVDISLFQKDSVRLQEEYKQRQATGEITNPRENILVFFGVGDGIVHFNTTRVVKHNPTDVFDVSRAEVIARKQIKEMVDFLRERSHAFDNATLIDVAGEIGIRESRMLNGEYTLTGEDLRNCVAFPDSIAVGNYEIDIHSPDGTGTSHYFFKPGEYYQIPYRCLLPKELSNLLVAGRCISTTHEAQASIRIMPICACLGEAAGAAIALAHPHKTDVHQVDTAVLREVLRQSGAEVD